MTSHSANYAAHIVYDKREGYILVTVFDFKTQEIFQHLREAIPSKDAKQFVNNIPMKFKNFKIIILSVYDFHSQDYKINLEFCYAIQEKLQLINARYLFLRTENLQLNISIYSANITVNVGENIVIANLVDSHFYCWNFEFTENGYLLTEVQRVPYNGNDNVKKIRESLTAAFNPKELIIVADGNDLTKLKKMPNVHFVTLSDSAVLKDAMPFLTDCSKWLHDKNSVKNLILPTLKSPYVLVKYLGGKSNGELLVADKKQILPCAKTLLLPNSKCSYEVICIEHNVDKIVVLFSVGKDGSIFPEPAVEQDLKNEKCHGIKFTVEVDVNSFPTFTFRPMILKGIKTLPQVLDERKAEIPVIGFFENLSVICVRKNGEKYGFLEEWGGMYGSELFISFDEEKPKYGEAASAMLKTKPTFVVYDLLKIMSMPATEIPIDETWHFNITDDSDNPVLIEFDNFDGKITAASPQLLLALLLKQHLKAIKNEVGKKPEKVGFCFFKVDDSVKERLKNQICESFELLKMKPEFIDI